MAVTGSSNPVGRPGTKDIDPGWNGCTLRNGMKRRDISPNGRKSKCKEHAVEARCKNYCSANLLTELCACSLCCFTLFLGFVPGSEGCGWNGTVLFSAQCTQAVVFVSQCRVSVHGFETVKLNRQLEFEQIGKLCLLECVAKSRTEIVGKKNS